jgi:predicted TIM-barrel fold metal-dependent hydrolase
MSVNTLERPSQKARFKPDYPIWDCDHHYYEPPEAFLRHLPEKYHNDFQYITLANGRTKLAIEGKISDFIPNPTFSVVTPPGGHEDWYRGKNPQGLTLRELADKPIPLMSAMRNGAAHLKLMDEFGLHAAMIFPTLASVVEVRLGAHRPDMVAALFHSLNLWVADEYGFGNGRQFPVGAVSLVDPGWAVQELEFLIEAGCRAVQVRPAPVPGPFGGRSPAAPEFDPFWARAAEAKILVTHHVGDSGYDVFYRDWTGTQSTGEMRAFERNAFKEAQDTIGRASTDLITALVCHGLFDRHRGLRVAVVESGSDWMKPMLHRLGRAYARVPKEFTCHPRDTVHEHVSVMPFYEESARELGELIGMENVLFGSDWPHAEGLRHPLDYYDDIADLTPQQQKMVMCDNTERLLEGRW